MKTVYKLTTPDRTTHDGFRWEPGKWYKTNGIGDLCTPGWLHAYEHPLLAVLHNHIHANLGEYWLWEAIAGGRFKHDSQMKLGATRMKIVKRIQAPEVGTVQRFAYGVLAAKSVYTEPRWMNWANNWLDGSDRTKTKAAVAADAARASKEARAVGAIRAAVAAWAASAVVEADASWATRAARIARAAKKQKIDLIQIAKEAMKVK